MAAAVNLLAAGMQIHDSSENTALSQTQSENESEFAGAIAGMAGGAAPPGGEGGGGGPCLQNAPGINVINNSRVTSVWARKAWLDEMAKKKAAKADKGGKKSGKKKKKGGAAGAPKKPPTQM